MGRINTNVQSLLAQRVLGRNTEMLNTSLERLSTGLRITRGKDDPAGLIASENLRSEQKAMNQAIANAERADQVVNIAEGGLQEVQSLLIELQGVITSTANTAGQSNEERAAAQLSVDSILQTIDRIASKTNFQGIRLLNGNLDFTTSGVAAGVSDFRVNSAKFSGAALDVSVSVTASAQQAGLFLSLGGPSLNISTGSAFVVEISGTLGAREFSFTSGTSLSSIATAINSLRDVTGVNAAVSGTGLRLTSTDYGSNAFVSVRTIEDGEINLAANGAGAAARGIYRFQANDDVASTTAASDFATLNRAVRDTGQDISASVNGLAATGSGRSIRVASDFLDVQMTLTESTATTLGSLNAFSITGGGAQFQLGPRVDSNTTFTMGIANVSSNKLGNSVDGFLNSLASGGARNVLNGDRVKAQEVVSAAIGQVSELRGRLGTFQRNTIGATLRNLGVAIENTAAAQSIIRDADFAAETAQLTRAQILVSASTNTLALANNSPQTALQLLG